MKTPARLGPLLRLLEPPELPDPDDSRSAQLVNASLLVTIVVPPLLITADALGGRAPGALTAMRLGVALVALFLKLRLAAGRLRLASFGIVVALFSFAVGGSLSVGTVRSTTPSLLLIDIAFSGVVLGVPTMIAVTSASILAYVAIAAAEASGWIAYSPTAAPSQVIGFASLCVGVGVLTYLGRGAMVAALARARAEVAERRRAEAELEHRDAARRVSEERYRLISEVISDYTFSTRVDERSGLVLDWVAGAFQKITGYDYEEYVSRGGWRAALHPDDVAKDEQDMQRLGHNETVDSELRTIEKSGAVRWVRIYAHPVWDAERDLLVGIYGAVQDVTERRRVETERLALIRELEAKNRELEGFTYAVSHDLRSPIITVRGFLGYLKQHLANGDQAALDEDFERILAATGRMDHLLQELLTLSRAGRIVSSPGPVGLKELVGEAVDQLSGVLTARGVAVELEEDLPHVFGDRARLLQVMQNLLENAAKFMGPQPDPRVVVAARRERDEHVILVRDNGIGVPAQLTAKIFGMFEKLDARTEGTGIGLALVKKIVESHGGRVFVESTGEGRGSTFGFTLPIPDSQVGAAARGAAQDPAPS